jgi:photosystem II stability/assembly factor-like uncharacterized protein
MKTKLYFLLLICLLLSGSVYPEMLIAGGNESDSAVASAVSSLKWRSIGPAFTSGRISDFAVNPKNPRHYFVAVASGNIWLTTNAGTTFEPVFDNYGAYSIGALAMDPNNPFVIWAGTGEHNHQRALGYGDGVYKSIDGGKSWKNMGLKDSRQIGEIAIDPRNSDIVFVAAEGSVWGPGGERGLYKTIDGGKSWKKVLDISENTGVNNIIYDPRNPDVMYATSEQRRRHVYTKIGGGPESAVYKSLNGGESWDKIMTGLPSVHLGGMDIAYSPANPDVLYLILEAAENEGGFYRSTNRGSSWEKMSSYTSSGQYFNEIWCDPQNVHKVYSVDVVSKVTLDGGRTWQAIGLNNRHVDDHAMWINPDYTDHFLIGGDGGIYETFDGGNTYDFKENLPVTQFYRVNVDNSYPFYYVYGGTQDNNSMGGPSGTISADGIVNNDWFITNGGDGFWTAVDPEDPNIVYAEAQYGNMVRYDRRTGEAIDIRPEPGKDEPTYKWNWNTPLIISPHKNTRLYCASEFIFKSDDRGNSWQKISDDLTSGIDRNEFPVMDKYWGADAVSKDKSTSLFGTVVSFAESPLKENLLFAGSDDGVISISEDAKTWKKFNSFPGVPSYTYVSDICASIFDENIVFASFDNILRDDFKPYIYKSTDKGKSWKSIAGNLPLNGTVHTIEQDFINPDLLFVGTEFGVFFTTDGGVLWSQLKNGLPTISVKDIVIQKREHDLVIATFGRGFYILDNYAPIREMNKEIYAQNAHIFQVKDALSYVQSYSRYGQGSTYFKAPNPEFGAVFTYYLKDAPKTLAEERKEKEKELFKEGKKITEISHEEQRAEKEEIAPYLVFTVRDKTGRIIRKLTKGASKGINRIVWDLRNYSTAPAINRDKFNPLNLSDGSYLVAPGSYTVEMEMICRKGVTPLAGPVEFKVLPLSTSPVSINSREEIAEFQRKANELSGSIRGANGFLNEMSSRVQNIKNAILSAPASPRFLLIKADSIALRLRELSLRFSNEWDHPSVEENPPSPVSFNSRLNILLYTHYRSTSEITQNELNAYSILAEEFPPVLNELKKIYETDLKNLESELETSNVPWTPGRIPLLRLE